MPDGPDLATAGAVPRCRGMKPLRLVTVCALSTLLCSCFTMGLWGFLPEDDTDPITGDEETAFAYDEETEWSWELLGLRVLLTPVTLCLDCVTAPVQCFLWGGDDDDDHCRRRR